MSEPADFRILHEPSVAHINFLSESNIKRLEEQSEIMRFKGINMLQRFSVADHNQRVTGFSSVAAECFEEIDTGVVLWDGAYHDEPERRTDDVTTDIKMAMTDEERSAFEEWEMEVMAELEATLDKPTWATSATDIYEKYRKKDTVESKLVNFFDKWDASNEVVHELVCGNGDPALIPILKRYKGTIEELRVENAKWLLPYETIFGANTFTVPDAKDLVPKKVSDLSFESRDAFFDSILKDNPSSYATWLVMGSFIWSSSFLDRTFPGWLESMPPVIIEASHMYMDGYKEYTTRSGLVINSDETKKAMKFAKDLGSYTVTELLDFLDGRGAPLRFN